MTIEEYCQEELSRGYGTAVIDRETNRIVTPYGGSEWGYFDENGIADDQIGELEVDERTATTVDGRYSLARHSGIYEELYRTQKFDLYADICDDDPAYVEYRCIDLTVYEDLYPHTDEDFYRLLLLINESNGEVHYFYGNRSTTYHYQLLCEVGELFKSLYEAKLEELGYTTDCKELDHYPWLVEYIPSYKPQE